jgi:Tol biopolymer transport system component
MRTRMFALATAAAAVLLSPIRLDAQATSVNGEIAFEVCEFISPPGVETCDIWKMNPDGSEQTNLTNTPEINEMWPAWSPDGTRIAYVEGTNFVHTIWVMNSDGTGQAPIVSEPFWQFGPTWSADGTQIAFTRQVPGEVITTQFDILVANVDGSGETNITHSDFDELDAAWSPDGSKIAFAGVRFEEWSEGQGAQWEIVLVNPDGSGEQILTGGEPGSPRATMLEEDRAPAWSPDSALLVYQTQSVDPCCPPWQLEKVDADGTDIRLLSDNPAWDDVGPEFSPDGTLVIFASNRDGDLAFYTMPAPTVDLTNRPDEIVPIPTPPGSSSPSWGRKPLAFEPVSLAVDVHGAGLSDANGVLEPGESVIVEPAWRNILTASLAFTGTASELTGAAGGTYVIDDATADFGTAAPGASSGCYDATPAQDCYRMTISGSRPALHWDATFDEDLASSAAAAEKTWTLHVGGSFSDVPSSEPFYPFVENLFHNGVTQGCGGDQFCVGASVTRAQMAVFLLKAKHGAGYTPGACVPGTFLDVACPSPFADWIQQLFQDGITGGCGGGNYCPEAPVTRAQMAVFLLKTSLGSAYAPPDCTGAVFADVPCSGGAFDPWIEDLAGRGITGGCGGGNYCPGNANTRGQMAVFLVKTFGLKLYAP